MVKKTVKEDAVKAVVVGAVTAAATFVYSRVAVRGSNVVEDLKLTK